MLVQLVVHQIINPFMQNGISCPNQLDESIFEFKRY